MSEFMKVSDVAITQAAINPHEVAEALKQFSGAFNNKDSPMELTEKGRILFTLYDTEMLILHFQEANQF